MTDRPALFDFDDGEAWLPDLRSHLGCLLPTDSEQQLRAGAIEDCWDAKIALAQIIDLSELYEPAREWINGRDVVCYHGTRLDAEQRASVSRHGLIPLDPAKREEAIRRYLAPHPRWREIEGRVAEAIDFVGDGGAGNRQGQVHLTLSGAGLLRGFNHYLVEGAEFDHHVANYLLGEECHDLNRERGQGLLYRARLDGSAAVAAANPFGEPNPPNLLGEIIETLAWFLATGRNDTANLELDCGLILYEGIAPDAIIEVVEVPDDTLWGHYDHRLR